MVAPGGTIRCHTLSASVHMPAHEPPKAPMHHGPPETTPMAVPAPRPEDLSPRAQDFAPRRWEELERDEAMAIFRLRSLVFVVEQESIYLDLDGTDVQAWHLACWRQGHPVAYCRVFASGEMEPDAAVISRVVTEPAWRGHGLATRAMDHALALIRDEQLGPAVRVHAQEYLVPYYERMGFCLDGTPYDWDGILHVNMIRPQA